MEPAATELAVLAMRRAAGFSYPAPFAVVAVRGQEAAAFLQARTTNDVLALESGQGQLSCLLDRQAHVLACFSLHRLDDGYLLLAEADQLPAIVEQLKRYHFNEKVELAADEPAGEFVLLQGPASRGLLSAALDPVPLPPLKEYDLCRLELWGLPVLAIKRTFSGEEGFLLWCRSGYTRGWLRRFRRAAGAVGAVELSGEAMSTARLEAGIPRYGQDLSRENLLPETGLEESTVSYTKGCYQGQEVIARLKSFGAPRRGLAGLLFASGRRLALTAGCRLMSGATEIGQLRSSAYSPCLERTVAFAYLVREHRLPGQKLEFDLEGQNYEAEVALPPFYRPPSARQLARQLYDRGLSAFAGGDEEKAVRLLSEALDLDPLFGDCYEALGVVLSRHERLEEAVKLMQRLAELDPGSVMAHANLSVFYMQQGDKEKAEDEKALAMSIRMSELAREVAARDKDKEDEKRKQEEGARRLAMFAEVLALDGDDLLANYGSGSACVDLGQYERAIPFLLKAIAVKPTHTVAYLSLGAAYAALGRTVEARDTYRRGIEVAARRGDMTPLKEMQARLAEIEPGNVH